MKTIQPIVVCPMCFGTGEDYSIKHHKMVECSLCKGRRWIPLESCKGCGRPAFKWWPLKQKPILRYCGLEECFNRLVKIHKGVTKVYSARTEVQQLCEDAIKRGARILPFHGYAC